MFICRIIRGSGNSSVQRDLEGACYTTHSGEEWRDAPCIDKLLEGGGLRGEAGQDDGFLCERSEPRRSIFQGEHEEPLGYAFGMDQGVKAQPRSRNRNRKCARGLEGPGCIYHTEFNCIYFRAGWPMLSSASHMVQLGSEEGEGKMPRSLVASELHDVQSG